MPQALTVMTVILATKGKEFCIKYGTFFFFKGTFSFVVRATKNKCFGTEAKSHNRGFNSKTS